MLRNGVCLVLILVFAGCTAKASEIKPPRGWTVTPLQTFNYIPISADNVEIFDAPPPPGMHFEPIGTTKVPAKTKPKHVKKKLAEAAGSIGGDAAIMPQTPDGDAIILKGKK